MKVDRISPKISGSKIVQNTKKVKNFNSIFLHDTFGKIKFSKENFNKIKPILKKTGKYAAIAALGLTAAGFISYMAHAFTQKMLRGKYEKSSYLADLSAANPESIDDFSKIFIYGRLNYMDTKLSSGDFKIEAEKGMQPLTTGKEKDIVLARNAARTANYMKTAGNCYTGVKHALLTSGVIDDYGDMPKGVAQNALEYFMSNPQKFQRVLHNGEKLTTDELRSLPEGMIVVYSKDGLPGHVCITNGKSQGMSDNFDNMMWIEDKGAGSDFEVFELSDNWKFNRDTKKLEFLPPQNN